jgi:acetyl-CoA acetyltransferase
MALLLAGVPVSVPGETVNRLCASGMAAAINVVRAIGGDEGKISIAGGVENMTRAPYVLSKPSSSYGRDAKLYDTSIGWRLVNPRMQELYGIDSMGETAENVAELFEIMVSSWMV